MCDRARRRRGPPARACVPGGRAMPMQPPFASPPSDPDREADRHLLAEDPDARSRTSCRRGSRARSGRGSARSRPGRSRPIRLRGSFRRGRGSRLSEHGEHHGRVGRGDRRPSRPEVVQPRPNAQCANDGDHPRRRERAEDAERARSAPPPRESGAADRRAAVEEDHDERTRSRSTRPSRCTRTRRERGQRGSTRALPRRRGAVAAGGKRRSLHGCRSSNKQTCRRKNSLLPIIARHNSAERLIAADAPAPTHPALCLSSRFRLPWRRRARPATACSSCRHVYGIGEIGSRRVPAKGTPGGRSTTGTLKVVDPTGPTDGIVMRQRLRHEGDDRGNRHHATARHVQGLRHPLSRDRRQVSALSSTARAST